MQILAVGLLLLPAVNQVLAQGIEITVGARELRMCQGETQNLKVFVTGGSNEYQYQWYYSSSPILTTDSGWSEIAGANSDVLPIENVTTATTEGNAGYYYCKVFYGFNFSSSKKSERMSVVVDAAAPTVGNVQAAGTVCEGAELNMVAQYVENAQIRSWYHGDEMLTHGETYHLAHATSAAAGQYTFIATNACGTTTYGPYEISVTELPRIVTQPRSAALCGGDDLTFRVVATGDNLEYQWYYDGATYPSVNTTSTTSTLVIEDAESDPQFYSNTFYVQVSNACATVTSISVGTIVSEVPSIVGNPLPETVCAGTTVELSADATTNYPTDTLTYQWILNDEPVAGMNTNIISFEMDSAHMGNWYCEFTNGCGTVSSNLAYVSVKMPPVVETQPHETEVCEGEPFSLDTKVTGYQPITYTWQKDNGDGAAFTNITMTGMEGVNASVLSAATANEVHEHYYFCIASNECGSVHTDTVFVNVNQHITVYPATLGNFSLCSGVDTIISIADRIYEGATHLEADELESITFAWHKEGSDVIISETPELAFANVNDDIAGYYLCDITNACGTESCERFYVSVIESPVITVQPQDLDVCTGGSISLSITATGDDLRYSWYRDGEFLNNNVTYSAPTVDAAYGGQYHCVVTSQLGCGAISSDVVTVTVGTNPVITWQPTPAIMSLCEGEEYDLTMTATGEGVHYQWYNNGAPLAGQTSTNLHIGAVTRSNSGVFYCIASNACDDVASEQAHLTVNNAPDMTLGPDLNPCRGESVVLAPQGQEEYGHYSWNYGTYGYQPTLTVALGGTYILEVSDSAHGNCVARDTVRVVFHDYFDIAFDNTPIVTCGEIVLSAGEGAAEYSWSTTEVTSSIAIAQNGNYMVTVDGDGYGCTTSASVSVTIGEEISINLGDDMYVSVDSLVEIGVPAVFEAYRWNTGFTGPKLTVEGSEYGLGAHNFWLEVTNGGCYARDSIRITFIENGDIYVAENEMPEISIYPNPASDFVNVVSANGAMSEIQIYDLTGRLVFDENPESEYATINVNAFVNSTYFVRIVYANGNAEVSKLVIQK